MADVLQARHAAILRAPHACRERSLHGGRLAGAGCNCCRESEEVIVEQTITSYADRMMSYTAFVLFPDRPRQERLVTDLAPGASVVKTYRFPDPAAGAEPTSIRSGLRELEGTRILNDRVDLE